MILIKLVVVLAQNEGYTLPPGFSLPPGFTFPPDFTLPDFDNLPDEYVGVHQVIINFMLYYFHSY